MEYTVEFEGLDLDVSVAPNAKFEHGYFVYGRGGGFKNPNNNQVYPPVKGIVINGKIDKPASGRELFDPLDSALYLAEEILTGLVATTQANFTFRKPITCKYNGVVYEQDDGFWREVLPRDSFISGGETFVDDVSYFDVPKNFHPKYHFYRVAKDEANTIDYRILNAWRFLEAHYGMQGKKLVAALKLAKEFKKLNVDKIYESYRCAVAHASDLKENLQSERVIVPRHIETAADGDMHILAIDLTRTLDEIVKNEHPQPIQKLR